MLINYDSGNISGSDLVCKLMQLQLPSRPSTQHPVSPGVAEILGDGETPNVDTLSRSVLVFPEKYHSIILCRFYFHFVFVLGSLLT